MQQIVSEFDAYMRQFGVSSSAWYVGIATDPRERLFSDHGVQEKGDAWKFVDCGSDAAARWLEQHFLGRGCRGGSGGGDQQTRYFYMYRVGPHTSETN